MTGGPKDRSSSLGKRSTNITGIGVAQIKARVPLHRCIHIKYQSTFKYKTGYIHNILMLVPIQKKVRVHQTLGIPYNKHNALALITIQKRVRVCEIQGIHCTECTGTTTNNNTEGQSIS